MVSIVIPLYKKTPYFFESVGRCLELDYPDFEILIGVDQDQKVAYQDKRIRVLRTGKKNTGPAEKRDLALTKAKGSYIAFLDDDSYPEENWLKKSIEILNTQKVTSVCGPGLTPPWDSFGQLLTGGILSSFFGSGPYSYRFAKREPRFVDDYPAYNMIVSKKVLDNIGGFGTKYYGGEDTALCIKLINAGEKIYYHPDIVVYHHRRQFPFEYARQVGNVGKHRGYFVKAYPQTSLRISYFGPALLVVSILILLILSFFKPLFLDVLLFSFVAYYGIVLIESADKNSLWVNIFLPFAIIANHIFYAVQFLNGFIFIKKLER